MKSLRYISLGLLFMFCLVSYKSVSAQIIITDDSVIVREVFHVCPSNIIYEDFGEGPTITGYFRIKNTSPDSIKINTDKIEAYYDFLLGGEKRCVMAFLSYKYPNATIAPNESLDIRADASLLLRPPITTIFNYQIVDFASAIIEVSPTLIFRIENNGTECFKSIKHISISNNFLTIYPSLWPDKE